MKDPVFIETGQTYEREAIVQWLKDKNSTCPRTGIKLTKSCPECKGTGKGNFRVPYDPECSDCNGTGAHIITNWAIKSAIAEFHKRNSDEKQDPGPHEAASAQC